MNLHEFLRTTDVQLIFGFLLLTEEPKSAILAANRLQDATSMHDYDKIWQARPKHAKTHRNNIRLKQRRKHFVETLGRSFLAVSGLSAGAASEREAWTEYSKWFRKAVEMSRALCQTMNVQTLSLTMIYKHVQTGQTSLPDCGLLDWDAWLDLYIWHHLRKASLRWTFLSRWSRKKPMRKTSSVEHGWA